MNIKVDAELKALIPPLSKQEREQLEQNIIENGCRDPLVVWNGLIVDGHNRYEICTRLGIDYKVVEIDLQDRNAVEDWMDANQLGRRNLTPDAFKMLLGRRYNRMKQPLGGQLPHKGVPQIGGALSTAEKLAKEHAVSKNTVERAAKFYEEVQRTPELKKAVEEGRPVLQVKRELKEKAREEKREENRAKIAAIQEPEKVFTQAKATFSTIVIDPPWDWGDEGDKDQLGRARPDYSTMSIYQLLDLPVGELASEDAHIYMWITNRSLPKGFALLEKWGFRYITAITWVKPHFGMGNYFRGQTEHVLFGVKGSQPLKRKDVGTVFEAPRGAGGHSSKPESFYSLVESCSHGPYLEMFSRSDRNDWITWGEDGHAAD